MSKKGRFKKGDRIIVWTRGEPDETGTIVSGPQAYDPEKEPDDPENWYWVRPDENPEDEEILFPECDLTLDTLRIMREVKR